MSPLVFGSDFSYKENREIPCPDRLYWAYVDETDIALFAEIGTKYPDATFLEIRARKKVVRESLEVVKKVPFSDDNLSLLNRLNKLENIEIYTLPVKGRGLHFLSPEKLRRICISECTIEDELFANLSHLTNLENLNIDNCFRTLKKPDLGYLTANRALHLCDFTGCNFPDDSFASFPKLRELKSLALSENNLTGENFHFLRDLIKLESLDLNNNPITTKGIEVISQNVPSRFNSLMIMDCPDADDDWIKHISGIEQLEALYLKNACITDVSLPYFQKMQNLDYLSLDGCDISLDACQEINKACRKLTISLPNGEELVSRKRRGI